MMRRRTGKAAEPVQNDLGTSTANDGGNGLSDTELDPRTGQPWRYPPIKCLLYGEGAAGKTTFVASYIKALYEAHGLPSLVFGFDPPGKMWPYMELGDYGPPKDPEVQAYYASFMGGTSLDGQPMAGIAVTDVTDPHNNDALICRIEHYAEPENVNLAQAAGVQANPRSWINFNSRLIHFGQEAPNYGLVVPDSMTGLIYANMCLQRAVKPMAAFEKGQDTRQWYSMATDDVEGLLKSRLPWWQTTVFVVCHVAGPTDKEEFAEGTLRGVSLVGRLNKNAVQCYEEMWRMKVVPDIGNPGNYTRVLQTSSDNIYTATSLIAKAPNPCLPDYSAVWLNYRKRRQGNMGEAEPSAPPVSRSPQRRPGARR